MREGRLRPARSRPRRSVGLGRRLQLRQCGKRLPYPLNMDRWVDTRLIKLNMKPPFVLFLLIVLAILLAVCGLVLAFFGDSWLAIWLIAAGLVLVAISLLLARPWQHDNHPPR